MSTGFIPFFAILFLLSIISMANGQLAYPAKTTAKEYPTTTKSTTTKGYPTTTTTTTTGIYYTIKK